VDNLTSSSPRSESNDARYSRALDRLRALLPNVPFEPGSALWELDVAVGDRLADAQMQGRRLAGGYGDRIDGLEAAVGLLARQVGGNTPRRVDELLVGEDEGVLVA
jgi:hypothetical protein